MIALIGGGNCSSQNNLTTLKKKKNHVVQTKILNVQTSSFCCCRDPFASRMSDSRIANGRPYIICPNLFSSSAILSLSLAYKIVKKKLFSLCVTISHVWGISQCNSKKPSKLVGFSFFFFLCLVARKPWENQWAFLSSFSLSLESGNWVFLFSFLRLET